MVRSSDKKSPREAVEFILELLKYNDNSGNSYSDVFWVAALVQAVGELEFGQQSVSHLPSLLKRLDRLLQFDRLMPSHNGMLTVCCMQSLTQMALKLSDFIPLDHVIELIKPYRVSKTWQIQVAASKALLELEFQCKGIDAALTLLIKYLNDETSLRGQTKLVVCALRLCQMTSRSNCVNDVKSETLVALLHLLESHLAFNNIALRHYIFCILQVLAGRAATLYGVPRDETRMGHRKTCKELENLFAALVKQQSKSPEASCAHEIPPEGYTEAFLGNHESTSPLPDTSLVQMTQHMADAPCEQRNSASHVPGDEFMIPKLDMPSEDGEAVMPKLDIPSEGGEPIEQFPQSDTLLDMEASRKADTYLSSRQETEPVVCLVRDNLVTGEADTVSNSHEIKKPRLKIKVKQSSRVEDPPADKATRAHKDGDGGASSWVSVAETGNHKFEDANSWQEDVGSRVTASIGSAKPTEDLLLVKELECTADSSKVCLPDSDQVPTTSTGKIDTAAEPQKEQKKKKKDKEKKRKKDDPERMEHKRRKKEKKRKEKEMAKLLAMPANSNREELGKSVEESSGVIKPKQPAQTGGQDNMVAKLHSIGTSAAGEANVVVNRNNDGSSAAATAPSSHKIKIKLKNRTFAKS